MRGSIWYDMRVGDAMGRIEDRKGFGSAGHADVVRGGDR